MNQRIYIVESLSGPAELVMATSQAQALMIVAKDRYRVRVASATEVATLMEVGAHIVRAETKGDQVARDELAEVLS